MVSCRSIHLQLSVNPSAQRRRNLKTEASLSKPMKCFPLHARPEELKQAAISQKEIVFRFRKDVQSEKGWGLMSCAKEVLV